MRRPASVGWVCVLAAAMVATTAGPRDAWAEPAAGKIAAQIESLRASAAALESGGFRSQGRKLTKAVDAIAQWAATNESLTTGQINDLQKMHKRLTSDAKMWAGAARQEKADVLTQHATAVQAALAAMEPLAKAAAGGGGGGTLTVIIRGTSGETSDQTQQRRQTPRAPTGGPVAGMGGPAAGMGGPAAGMGFRGNTTHSAYGDAPAVRAPRTTRNTRTTRRSGAAAGPAGLTIILREPNKTFSNAGQLRSYLNTQADELGTAAVEFRIDGAVRWSDVQMVVNAVAAAPLTGPMTIAGLKLRQGPTTAAAATGVPPTPPGPLPAGLTGTAATQIMATVQPATPTPAPTEGQGANVLGPELDTFLKEAKTVLFAVDVTEARFMDVVASITARVGDMPATMSVAVIAVNAENRAEKIVDWTAAGLATAASVGVDLMSAGPAGNVVNIATLAHATQAEFVKSEAIVYVVEASLLPSDQVALGTVYGLRQTQVPTAIVVVGAPGSEMAGVIRTVGSQPNNVAVFAP